MLSLVLNKRWRVGQGDSCCGLYSASQEAWELLTEVLLSPAFSISLSFLPALFYTGKHKFPFSGLSGSFMLLRSTPQPKATWGRRASFAAVYSPP